MIEEKTFYWKILDNLDVGVYFANKKKQITYWNKAAEEMTGFKSNEVLGRCCADNILCHIDSNGEMMCSRDCPLSLAFSTGKPAGKKMFFQHKKGSRIPIQIQVNPIHGEDNEIIGAVEIFSNLSSSHLNVFNGLSPNFLSNAEKPVSHVKFPNQRYLEIQLKTRLFQWQEFNLPFGIFSFSIEFNEGNVQHSDEAIYNDLMNIITETIYCNLGANQLVGEWKKGVLMGIVETASKEELQDSVRQFRILLEKTHLASWLEKGSLSFVTDTTMVQTDDTMETLIRRIGL